MNESEKDLQQDQYDKTTDQTEQQQLTKQERRRLKRQRKRKERKQERRRLSIKKTIKIIIILVVVVGGIFGLGWFLSNSPSLPPTTQQNHSEESPSAHIVTQPISDVIQRHMLEHSDGNGKPGIIIQYNCNDFDCDSDLVQNLTALVGQYPDNVYLAPNNYDAKIVLTRLNKIKTLDSFDEQMIKDFIE